MTSTPQRPLRPIRSARSRSNRADLAPVEIGRGVKMSCEEIDDDHAVMRFVCASAVTAPRPSKRRTARET